MNKLKFFILLFGSLMLGCGGGVTEKLFYKAEVDGGNTSDTYLVEIPINENISIGLTMSCAPKKTRVIDYTCFIDVYVLGTKNVLASFRTSQFIVQGSRQEEIKVSIDDRLSLLSSRYPKAIGITCITIDFQVAPNTLYLQIPQLLIDGKLYDIPEVKFLKTESKTSFSISPMILIND